MPDRARAWLGGVAGLAGLVALWWLLAVTVFDGSSMPTPPGVLRQYAADGWAFYANNFGGTVVEALIGFAWGNGLALVLAALVLLTPRLEPVISQIAVISYCVPTIAILPILYIVLGPPDSGEPSPTAVVLAALSVFFTTVVGAVLGFRSADRAALDVVARLRRRPLEAARHGAARVRAAGDHQRPEDRGPGRVPRRDPRGVHRQDGARRRHRDDPRPAELNAHLVWALALASVPWRSSASRCSGWSPARSHRGRRERMTTLTTATERQATELQATAPPAADLSRDVRRAATRTSSRPRLEPLTAC